MAVADAVADAVGTAVAVAEDVGVAVTTGPLTVTVPTIVPRWTWQTNRYVPGFVNVYENCPLVTKPDTKSFQPGSSSRPLLGLVLRKGLVNRFGS